MLQLRIEQFVPAPPDDVWPLVTEPARMSLWSTVPIEPLAAGDGGTFGGVGALRRVSPRGALRRLGFREVVTESDPPWGYAYRMVDGPARAHRGAIELHPRDGGTLLRWSVDADLVVPGEWLASLFLRWQLGKSLRNLARIAPAWVGTRGTSRRRPARLLVVDPDEVRELLARADATLAAQRSLRESLRAAGDPKHWFLSVYAHVTEGEIAACRRELIAQPDWSLRVVPDFWEFYLRNLLRWQGLAGGEVEPHWQCAFAAQEQNAGSRAGVLLGVREGAWAHIERDLPRSLARVYAGHFAARCDYARFRADYLALAHQARVFRHASDAAMRELGGWPGALAALAAALLPPGARDALQERLYYPVLHRRLDAFEAGGRIAAREAPALTAVNGPRARNRREQPDRPGPTWQRAARRGVGGARH